MRFKIVGKVISTGVEKTIAKDLSQDQVMPLMIAAIQSGLWYEVEYI